MIKLIRCESPPELTDEVKEALTASPGSHMEELAFPPAILAPDSEHYILETDSEGLLLPVDDCGYPLEQQPVFCCSGTSGYGMMQSLPHGAGRTVIIIVRKFGGKKICLICFMGMRPSGL